MLADVEGSWEIKCFERGIDFSMAASFRFIHLADVHLDTNFYGEKSEIRHLLQQETRKCLERAVDLALAEKVQAVLIAGDLFDQDLLSFASEKVLMSTFKRLEVGGISVFYAPGNHDPFAETSGISRLPWPGNVHIFDGSRPEKVTVKDDKGEQVAAVTGMGHESRQEERNLAALFPTAVGSIAQVALLHAQVVGHKGSDAHPRYAPCSLEDLRGQGYQYWALGHIHIYSRVAEEPAVYYPGNIQGRNPGETGSKGCLLVEVQEKELVRADFLRLSRLQWASLSVCNLEQVTTLNQLQRLLSNLLQQEMSRSSPGVTLLPRIYLSGPCPLYHELQWEDNLSFLQETLSEQMGFPWLEIKKDKVFPPVHVEKYRQGPHLLAKALELFSRAQEDDELLLSLAPHLLAAVETGAVGSSTEEKTAYLRELLDNLDKEMVLRMIK